MIFKTITERELNIASLSHSHYLASGLRWKIRYFDIGEAMTELLRTSEVSVKTGIREATLRWWRHRGEGPPSFKMGKKIVVYPADALEIWIRSQQASSTKGDQL